jgi:hypothetical protein
MLVLPLPGASAERVLEVLREQAALLSQADSDTGDRLNAYIRWANDAAVSVASVATARSVDQLVLTRRYWALQSATASKSMYKLLQVEFDDRARAFDSALGDLRREIDRWTRPGVFVLPDASFYIRHSDKLEHVDFRPLLGIWEEPVHVLVPIAIVDELDRLKESTNKRARWRARYTLAVLDDRLKDPNTPGQLRPEDFTPSIRGQAECRAAQSRWRSCSIHRSTFVYRSSTTR